MSCRGFFATRADLEPGIRAIETRYPLKYVRDSSWDTSDISIYSSALDIPDLGTATSRYLYGDVIWIMPASAELVIQPVPQSAGGIRYFFHRQDNLSAFILWPGGWYEGKLLGGGTCPDDRINPPEIMTLQQEFARAITKKFVKILGVNNGRNRHPWYVGPEALRALDAGTRLVTYDIAERYAPLDLKRPEKPE